MLGWLGLTAALAAGGILNNFSARVPAIVPLVLAANLAAIGVAVAQLGGRLIAQTPVAWLVGFQFFRVAVELVLVLLYHSGVVPVQMTFEGRNWDILVGLTALPVAWLLARGRLPWVGLLIWNIFGMGLLLNIVIISVLSMPTALRAFPAEPANTFIATMPYIWLPTFLVPTALCGHLLVFRHLLFGRSIAPAAGAEQVSANR